MRTAAGTPPLVVAVPRPGCAGVFSRREDNVSLLVGPQEGFGAARARLAGAVGWRRTRSSSPSRLHGAGVAVVAAPTAAWRPRPRHDRPPGRCAGRLRPRRRRRGPGRRLRPPAADRPRPRRGAVPRAARPARGRDHRRPDHAARRRAPHHPVVGVVGPAIGGCCYEVPAAMRGGGRRAAAGGMGHDQLGQPCARHRGGGGGGARGAGAGPHLEDCGVHRLRRDGLVQRRASTQVRLDSGLRTRWSARGHRLPPAEGARPPVEVA